MPIEKTYHVYDPSGKPTQLPPGTYFGYKCHHRTQTVLTFKESDLAKPCPKCGGTVLFTM